MSNAQPILLQAKPSAAETLVYWPALGLGLAIGCVVAAALLGENFILLYLFLFFALVSLLLSALWVWVALSERNQSLLTLTPDSLTVRQGFNQRIKIIPVAQVQQIVLTRPRLGQIFHYGTLRIESRGQSVAVIPRVPHPDKWQAKIRELAHLP